MDRRDSLKVLGAAATSALGGVGVYRTFSRGGGEPAPGEAAREWHYSPPEAEEDAWESGNDAKTEGEESAPETRDGQLLLGVTPADWRLEGLPALESWLGERHAVAGSFVDMSADGIRRAIDEHLETKWRRGHVPQLYLQPYLPEASETSGEIAREIADGEHDDVLHRWAEELSAWATGRDGPDRRCFLNFAPEMNGDWTPWSPATGDATEADYVDMWRHVHDTFSDAGLEPTHVRWIWALDNTTRRVDREACYPGDGYVDWVGVHGYNWVTWGGWSEPEAVYGDTIDVIRSITDRPLAVTEFACSAEMADDGHDPARKDAWIEAAYEYFRERDVRLTLWFDNDKETDWRVFGADPGAETVSVDGDEYEVYPAYREALAGDDVLGTHPAHPRRLTDEEFAGEF